MRRSTIPALAIASLVSSVLISAVAGSRILLLPTPNRSHSKLFSITARGLKDAGHDPWILVPETRKFLAEGQNVRYLAYPVGEGASPIMTDSGSDELFAAAGGMLDAIRIFTKATEGMNEMCEMVHQNEEIMRKMEDLRFDLAIVDGLDFVRCLYSIPYRLGLKYVTLTARHDPWGTGLPAMPSVEPYMGLGVMITKDSNILERTASLLMYGMFTAVHSILKLDDTIVTRYCPTKPKATLQELFGKSEMWLVNLETMCLDFPRVHGSHYQFVAGTGLEPAKPLPQEWEDFVQGSRVGFIVLTFGSMVSTIPEEMLDKMLAAFAQVEFRIVMRHAGPVGDKVPDNVKMSKWIPQGDLLGHPKARAFITHGGGNGQLEALHHAVPVITIPMFGDQIYNAKRAEVKGFGVYLNKKTFTTEELVDAIQKVAGGKDYRDNIRSCAEKFRSMPAPQDTISFWVEHIVRFGGDHLKPVALEVPLWKLFMVDVIILLHVVGVILCTCTFCVCRKVCRRSRDTKRVKLE